MTLKKTTNKTERAMHLFDAEGKVPGRLATEIARLLMGKNKVTYLPYLDQGDFVEVANVSKLKFTGKKLVQKYYYQPSFFPGGLKKTQLNKLFQKSPKLVFKKIVYQMLPKNKLRPAMIKRLTFKP
jgi:large subunit ribosomal protein L13